MDSPLLALEVGNTYYQCGCTEHNGQARLVVSTWVYLGTVSQNCTSPDCDQPYRYYKFAELQSHNAAQHQSEISPNVALIPSLAQVSLVMLDTDTFGSDVIYWLNAIRDGTALSGDTEDDPDTQNARKRSGEP